MPGFSLASALFGAAINIFWMNNLVDKMSEINEKMSLNVVLSVQK